MSDEAPRRTVLYTQEINPFAEKVARALRLKGVPFERVVPRQQEDIKRWSPVTHQLPVLEVDGQRLYESAFILRWLDEHYPEPPLLAADPKAAAAQERLAEWSDTSFLWYWNRWREARFPRPGDDQPLQAALLSRLRSRLGLGGRPASRVELREMEVMEELEHRLDDLVGFLGRRDFFRSDQPSVADLSIFGMLLIVRDGPMPLGDALVKERPSLDAYIARMEALTGRPED